MWNEVIFLCTILVTASGGFLGGGVAAEYSKRVFLNKHDFFASEMTYIVSGGALNSILTHSLTTVQSA